jgi:hypothetical protein
MHSALELLAAVSAGDDDPLRRDAHGGVAVLDVIGDRHELKVLKAVVSLVAVDVVNLLPSSESAAKMPPHDKAMLEDVESTARDLDVAVVSLSANRHAACSATHRCSPCGALVGSAARHRSVAIAWWTSPANCSGTLKGLRAATIGSQLGFSRLLLLGKPDA